MTTNRSPIARERRGRLTADQQQALWLGPLSDAFESEDDCHAAWERHRGSIMHLFAKNGRRPLAWWAFDSAIPYPGYDRERSVLFEANLLDPDEADRLVAYWKSEFAKASKPGFSYCAGPSPGGWLTGKAARQAHYAWADIPRPLIRQWEKAGAPPKLLAAESPADDCEEDLLPAPSAPGSLGLLRRKTPPLIG